MPTGKKNPPHPELTPDQREQIKAEIGRSATTIELTVEARITPVEIGIAATHNETLVVE
jgi:hypothetical protein